MVEKFRSSGGEIFLGPDGGNTTAENHDVSFCGNVSRFLNALSLQTRNRVLQRIHSTGNDGALS